MVCEFVFPETTDPKLALPGVRLIPACTPTPVTASTAFTPWVLVNVTLPEVVPLAEGAYCTVTETFCDGAIVTGVEIPLTDIPDPLAATCVSVTLELPVFDN
jgi:hypothetical protein